MIARVRGVLESVGEGRALVWTAPPGGPGVAREVLVPAAIHAELAGMVGREVVLETLEHLESVGQGSSYVPRLIGFLTSDQRALFELLTKVKGLGARRALRAFAAPAGEIAAAVAAGDAASLARLPEIGKRLAQTMTVELKDKVGALAHAPGGPAPGAPPEPASGVAEQAVAALVRLGETRAAAESLVGEALRRDAALASADEILTAAFALKG